MSGSLRFRIQVFDPKQEVSIIERRLPHWSQAGTISFITFRTEDSIPADVLKAWLAERDDWLSAHGIDTAYPNWRDHLKRLAVKLQAEFREHFTNRWNDHLDACHGECVLREPPYSKIVADALRYFDADRYDLTDFVVMPNHVHILGVFPDEQAMLKQCESWKRYTATQLNRLLDRRGRFWQQEGFDHLVRSVEQFEHLRRYIADNPRRARLKHGEFIHESKLL
jgi:type I restriction enzyme R subunit